MSYTHILCQIDRFFYARIMREKNSDAQIDIFSKKIAIFRPNFYEQFTLLNQIKFL